jgi:hypothetical protein
MTFSTDSQRRLIWHGMFLFLLGLLIGFVEGQVSNPRMALAAHLEGLMNGTFLIALGGGVAVCEAASNTHDRGILDSAVRDLRERYHHNLCGGRRRKQPVANYRGRP